MRQGSSAVINRALLGQACKAALIKLDPRMQWRNPVMFLVWLGSVLTTVLTVMMATGHLSGNAWFSAAISV